MTDLPTFGQAIETHARVTPTRLGARDLDRSMTFAEWNARSRRLANALLGLGLAKGDRVAVLAYNCVEWLEIYAACAKAGLIACPINFRLVAFEAAFIVENAEAGVLIAQEALRPLAEETCERAGVAPERRVLFGSGGSRSGWRDYEDLIARGADREPAVAVAASDPWTLMYTSGTTGNPKGVLRSHRGAALLSMTTDIELSAHRRDDALLVMPMCHANSVNFFGAFTWAGGAVTVYNRASFDPEHALRTLGSCGSTFTSLVPTHYIMLLNLSEAERGRADLGRMTKLMISSAPAREDTKRAVMEMFPNAGLFELYGSSESGWTTFLHPEEQFTKLGSVGRECVGTRPVRILDEAGNELPDGQPGELYQCTPYAFEGYWRNPEKTAEAFRGDYHTVGDMALRDEDGFIRLIDRKKNMIITGGENVYPSEVENAIGAFPKVQDVAVIGLPDPKWGERVHACVVLKRGAEATEAEIVDWCRERLAGFKRPRSVTFMGPDDLPRTATGKVLHRVLRDRLSADAG